MVPVSRVNKPRFKLAAFAPVQAGAELFALPSAGTERASRLAPGVTLR